MLNRLLKQWVSPGTRKLPWMCAARLFSHGSRKFLKDNIYLMGSPGCGKTTVGRLVAEKLALPVVDIDDDFLEPYWQMPVSEKLDEVGSAGFVQAEGEALFNFRSEGSVVSLTGSNPMYTASFDKLCRTGTVVFLDVHPHDILERLERMKVNRIVGQNDGTSMSSILKYRQQFYERSYDLRVICERNESPVSVAEKVISQLNRQDAFVSTRGFVENSKTKKPFTFNDAVTEGLAPNGGLFVPASKFPNLTSGQLTRMVDMNYTERAVRVLEGLVCHSSIRPPTLKTFIQNAYPSEIFGQEPFPVIPLRNSDGQYLLELFHGPTASFKDAALQLMPQLFLHALGAVGDKRKYLILVATSGDTGGAVIDGFSRHCGNSNIGVLVLYPDGGISNIQRQQMVSLASGNTQVIGVSGADFDFCQKTVKQMFGDDDLVRAVAGYNVKLSAANSISWGRLMPQIAYHVSAYLDLVQRGVISVGDEVDMCIPTGNFGNILAAYYAKEMGVPFKRLICASNSNKVLTDFFHSGIYDISNRQLELTMSPAIDILVSSNIERLIYDVTDQDCDVVKMCYETLLRTGTFTVPEKVSERLNSTFVADWCSEADCIETIRKTLNSSGYLLDPHTAVAKTVADRHCKDRPVIIASTAHPGKFADSILDSLGHQRPEMNNAAALVEQLDSVTTSPGPHNLLTSCLKQGPSTQDVCASSYKDLCARVDALARVI